MAPSQPPCAAARQIMRIAGWGEAEPDLAEGTWFWRSPFNRLVIVIYDGRQPMHWIVGWQEPDWREVFVFCFDLETVCLLLGRFSPP
jgi:hypothetical protein